jgi:CRISPR-associated protein Cmr3
MRQYLRGTAPSLVRRENWWVAGDLVAPEVRPGIAVDRGTNHVREGYLYFARHRRLRSGVRIGVEIEGVPDELRSRSLEHFRALPLGGEMRAARLTRAGNDAPWREEVAAGGTPPLLAGTRLKIVLLQPAWFHDGWHPRMPAGWRLVAARVERAHRTGGWDVVTGGPKPLRSYVPRGSVFFYTMDASSERADAEQPTQQPWTASVTDTPEGEPVPLPHLGFGFALLGTWEGH